MVWSVLPGWVNFSYVICVLLHAVNWVAKLMILMCCGFHVMCSELTGWTIITGVFYVSYCVFSDLNGWVTDTDVFCVSRCMQWTDRMSYWYWNIVCAIWCMQGTDWLSYWYWNILCAMWCMQWLDWLSYWYWCVLCVMVHAVNWRDQFLILKYCVSNLVHAVTWLAELLILICWASYGACNELNSWGNEIDLLCLFFIEWELWTNWLS